jgi:hypothetical protein
MQEYMVITRRNVIKALGATAFSVCAGGLPMCVQAAIRPLSNIPILMFHKVCDQPIYPEDISPEQLAAVLEYAMQCKYRPVNMSDIVTGRVDSLVPAGYKPLGITVDDAHQSVFFSRNEVFHPDLQNTRSFLDVLSAVSARYQCQPRATLFICRVGNNRFSNKPEEYFGGHLPLSTLVQRLHSTLPGVEMGYHTRNHLDVSACTAEEMRAILYDQIDDFQQLGVLQHIAPVFAYPFGEEPKKAARKAVAEMGFRGAFLAFPDLEELGEEQIYYSYEKRLHSNYFRIPRMNIGAWMYTEGSTFELIDPVRDFQNNVEKGRTGIYISQGSQAAPLLGAGAGKPLCLAARHVGNNFNKQEGKYGKNNTNQSSDKRAGARRGA